MSGAQKVSLSLLISVVVFSVLSVLVAVDRFRVLETRFYIPRVEESIRTQAGRASQVFDQFHDANIGRFREFTLEPSVQTAFRINASAAEIRERRNRLDTIEQEGASLDVVRIVDVSGTQLHYSSDPADYSQSGTQRTYLRPDQASADEPISLQSLSYSRSESDDERLSASRLPQPDIFLEPENNQFIYRLPAVDSNGVVQGAALFYVNTADLKNSLIRVGLIGTGDTVRIVNGSGVVANAPTQFVEPIVRVARREWAAIAAAANEDIGRVTLRSELDGGASDDGVTDTSTTGPPSYEAYAVASARDGIVVYLEPSSTLEMPTALQYTLLVAVFLTTFLIVFLLLNVRQDAIVVIADRVKRFQINLLREYMENHDQIDFDRWKTELEGRRQEVRREIRRGIGRVRSSQEEKVNELIDESWDQIINVLGARAEQRPAASLDVGRIEEIVNQLTERLSSAGIPSSPRTTRPGSEAREPVPVELVEPGDDDDVHEAEEMEEFDELGEPSGSEARDSDWGTPVEVE
ncbi:MAG: hypothetical protein ACOC2N_07610, partial [Spirochaetota bacterium]